MVVGMPRCWRESDRVKGVPSLPISPERPSYFDFISRSQSQQVGSVLFRNGVDVERFRACRIAFLYMSTRKVIFFKSTLVGELSGEGARGPHDRILKVVGLVDGPRALSRCTGAIGILSFKRYMEARSVVGDSPTDSLFALSA